MTLRFKISLFISLLFTALFGLASFFIIYQYAQFRKEEFRQRLEEKAINTIRLLVEVKEVDNQVLKTIDQNSINKLYDEKTLVFDAHHRLLYSSLDDTRITWTEADLNYLRQHKTFFKKEGDYEIYGVYHDTKQEDFYALISANDNYGKRKLRYLIYLVLVVYAVLTSLAWVLCFSVTRRLLLPLSRFHRSISEVNENNLAYRLETRDDSNNEIEGLAREFNHLLQRLEDAYQRQKEFTAQASHELRTPLARISARLENQLASGQPMQPADTAALLKSIGQITELINSLLVLSKVEGQTGTSREACRVDELLYTCIEKVHAENPAFRAELDMQDPGMTEAQLTILSNSLLLEIAFYNLLKNAAAYSPDCRAQILLLTENERLRIIIRNNGPALSPEEQLLLFRPFMRGSHARQHPGFGLGLRITRRILHALGHEIRYSSREGLHEFIIIC